MSEAPNLSELQYHLQKPVYSYHQYQGNSNNCGPTSIAIAANAYLGRHIFQGDQIAQELNNWWLKFPALILPRIWDWATFPWGMVQYMHSQHLPARWSLLGNVERLRRNLLEERITIVVVGEPFSWQETRYTGWGHAKVLFGYTPGQGYLFVDPGCTGDSSLADAWQRYGLVWQDECEFEKQWRNFLGIYVEVGGSEIV
jgi:hypothetical protein